MEIEKLEGSMQLAQMRHKAIGSEDTKTILAAAEKAYQDALGEVETEEVIDDNADADDNDEPEIPEAKKAVVKKVAEPEKKTEKKTEE